MPQQQINPPNPNAQNPLEGQWTEVFRTGDYNEKGRFSSADLDQMVANFDPSYHEPPVIVGKPKHDAPAYAWVAGLKRSGNTLLGKLKDVDPQFGEMVRNGRFKKRTVSLYSTAKGWAVRHLGFLGAPPPEVKGLSNTTFKEDDESALVVNSTEADTRTSAAISALKSRGRWMREFDEYRFPVIFSELRHASFRFVCGLLGEDC